MRRRDRLGQDGDQEARARRESGAGDLDCVVIGGGPGGLVSSLYLRRFRRRIALVSTGPPRATWIPRTHNLIGYDRGISGRGLLARLRRQVGRLGLEPIDDEARVHPGRGGRFEVQLARSGRSLRARRVILATGIEDVHPRIPNLIQLRRLGLLRYCSICDAFEFRGKPISVLAQDTAGLEKALFLSNWTPHIRVIAPTDLEPSTSWRRQLRSRGIILSCSDVVSIDPVPAGQEAPEPGVLIRLGDRKPFYNRAVYVELGAVVRDSAFAHLKSLRRDPAGLLYVTQEQRTSIPGLFAVGDCVNVLAQISVAAGQAAVAATAVHNDLL